MIISPTRTNMEHIRRTYLEKIGSNNTNPTPLNITTYINETVVSGDNFLRSYANYNIITQWDSIYVYTGLVFGTIVLISFSRMLCYKLAMNASINLHDSMFSNILQATMRFFDTNPSGTTY